MMKTAVCVVVLALAALALADDRPGYDDDNYGKEPKKESVYREERRYESSRGYGRYPEPAQYAPRGPYYGGPYYMGDNPHNIPSSYHNVNRHYRGGRYYYGGSYKGKCYQDGLYFMDKDSFVLCSNGNAYVQPCAPGTRNSERGSFRSGYYYGYSDFCDVNLVDYGYGPQHYATPYKGEDKHDEGYGEAPKEQGYKADDSYKTDSYGKSSESSYSQESYGSDNKGYDNKKEDYKPKTDSYKPDGYKKEETYVKESYSKEDGFGYQ